MTQDRGMNTDMDARLGALLRQAAPTPAPRDAMFRIQVMERRERERFQRRRILIGAGGAVAALVAVIGLVAGGDVQAAASGALIVSIAAMACMMTVPVLIRRGRYSFV